MDLCDGDMLVTSDNILGRYCRTLNRDTGTVMNIQHNEDYYSSQYFECLQNFTAVDLQ